MKYYTEFDVQVLAVAMVIVPTVYGRVLQGWPAAVDDFQDQPEEPVEEDKMMEKTSAGEVRHYAPPKETYSPEPHEYEGASASNDQGYFQGFAPKSIVLDDNQSIESRFAFPDFPK